MKIIYANDYQTMSRKAANILSAQVILNPKSVLGLATGSTPLGIYQQLIEWYRKGDIDFSQVKTVNLDEYCGLSPENEQSYFYYMYHNFFKHINIQLKNVHIPNGLETDKEKECRRYNYIIKSLGGIDLQLLGLGHNGHIGFNEPNEAFEKETHCVKLAEETIAANSRFFSSLDEVPTHAYTMGIKSIMQAKKILLIASGESKAEILYQALFGPISPQVPASILQLHNDLIVVADEGALSVIAQRYPHCIEQHPIK
ncbi:glucosamine-6-phosphate deaminase [Anaerobranca californiensis DSM 14826]|jgi:glucosamine-6-phosphate deaminase|uniref:Glucosamine-6-phosphate deaminase n=1 Tax=Anaerobranca californiensis DSM 14826 TaxID=1120989 RepID=A0A1M6R262_9FIRM|nr:glucosamine-6-phosphate deaminase [Anaerobranca californiensis]SHK26523.1 glucosamine-6-phosphate deaminase [Anaerobranca californiensis DSM 14826]